MVEDRKDGDDDKEDEPEPDEHIDLLVNHIDWKHTECIMGLDGPRRTIFLVKAFGHSWENSGHWINPVLRIVFHETCNLQSIATELAAKEGINEIYVANDIDESQEFTDEHLESP